MGMKCKFFQQHLTYTYLYTLLRCLNLFHLSLFSISTSFCNSFFTSSTEKRDEISHRSVFKRLLSLLCVSRTSWRVCVKLNFNLHFFEKFKILKIKKPLKFDTQTNICAILYKRTSQVVSREC